MKPQKKIKKENIKKKINSRNNNRMFDPDDPRSHHNRPRHGPPFRRPPFMSPPHIRKELLGRKSFKEMQQMICLGKIKDVKKGITGYKLQDLYDLPRGTLLRLLNSLESRKFLKIKEKIVNGRAQKLYFITKDGIKYLDTLRTKWAKRNMLIDDMAPIEKYGLYIPPKTRMQPDNTRFRPHHAPTHGRKDHRIKHFEDFPLDIKLFSTKEDALDFLHGQRSRLKDVKSRLNARLDRINIENENLNAFIKNIEEMVDYSPNKFLKIFKNRQNLTP